MKTWAWGLGVFVLLALGTSCRKSPVQPCPTARLARIAPRPHAPSPQYDSLFRAAGAEFRVSPTLLAGVGWMETRWQMVRGAEEFPGRPAAFGVMGLSGPALERAAALAGVSIEAAQREPVANIRAGAALLAAYAAEAGGDWDAATARFSGIDHPAGRAAYLAGVATAEDRPQPAPSLDAATCPPPPDSGPDFGSSIWRASPNFDARAADSTGVPHMLIIHTCESNYASCWSWLVNVASQVSAHYVVSEEGREVSQLVRERDRAWHIAALYDCALNRRHECWRNGVQSNHFTVGIEHAGFASQDSFPQGLLERSAALVCDITRDRAIPRDWQHIVGHGQLQPANRTDPGPNWPWIAYVHRVQALCGELVVDDSSQFNAPSDARVVVPAGWQAADTTPDYYGGGYRWASTNPTATDGVEFSFYVAASGARTLDARWTSGTNRSPQATYALITSAGDTLQIAPVDQRVGGGAWHTLGTWTLPLGWNRVVLMRRGASGAVLVADAVRVRQYE
ncbi:MAG TPA: N-acetylmuramoyl-L-alanine amidase [Gemmatimonadales bacterium]|nr:N-acetylmuramoyl-L-alanine amidase [Gemmatimonadales bacterium]